MNERQVKNNFSAIFYKLFVLMFFAWFENMQDSVNKPKDKAEDQCPPKTFYIETTNYFARKQHKAGINDKSK